MKFVTAWLTINSDSITAVRFSLGVQMRTWLRVVSP